MGSYRALLVANSKFYEDPDLLELKAPVYDMARMQEALTHPTTGIFSRDRVELLPNAKCGDVLLSMENFFQSCDAGDTLLLYYSGHGKLDLYNNFFLCASDTRLDRLVATAIKDEQVDAMIRTSPARTFVLLLDCCSSGSWKGTKELLPEPLKGSGRFLITSSRAGQNSKDAAIRTESSPFTRYLVEAISEADVDVDTDGYVDIDEIYRYVDRNLTEAGPQQAQRGFEESAGTVALARRPLTPTTPVVHPEPTIPIGPLETPSLNVTPDSIDVSGVRPGDLPVIERIYVFNRGGGVLDWEAASDDQWIGLEPVDDFVKVVLTPTSPGPNRGTVYVRERGGAVERVPVSVDLQRRPAIWDRLRKPALAVGAVVGSIALIAAAIAFASDGEPTPTPTPSSPSVEIPVETAAVLDWEQGALDSPDGDGRIEAIGVHPSNGDVIAAGTLEDDAAAWVLADGTWTQIPHEHQPGAQTIRGLTPFDDMLVGVGMTNSGGDEDAAAWSVSRDGITVAAEFDEPGDQVINRVSKTITGDGLVAVGRDGDAAAVWVFDGDRWEQVSKDGSDFGGQGTQEVMTRVQTVTERDGDELLIAVGYEQNGTDEDGAVWIAGDDDGRTWERIRDPELPFVGTGRQRILDVISNGTKGLIAVGYAGSDGDDDLDAAVWLSDDGRSWTRPEPSDPLGGPGDQTITRIHTTNAANGLPPIIAVGTDDAEGSPDAGVWYSKNGRTWVKQRITHTGLGGPGAQELSAFSVLGSGIFVVGEDDGSPAVWRGTCNDHPLCS